MGRAPCCDKANVKKGPWILKKTQSSRITLRNMELVGIGLLSLTKRLKRFGEFTDDEDRIICTLFATIGSRWSIIAAQLPSRTDNDFKNYWNTKLKKKLMSMTSTSQPPPEMKQEYVSFRGLGAYNGHGYEDNQRFMLNYGTGNGGENVNQRIETSGNYGECLLDYNLEDVKRLISSSGCDNSSFSLVDENNTQDKVMYYY
ncbi:Transcription factor RAX3 [Hibiscus syriacus]|uniref:Transcription factor RAX3 n=1 Tax=Hibiscus syriacus TaxID=106335 RepID=A0A6A3CG98_HIBSY|nr:Transcription factor RAX3 [Hibiscus syriacus]